VKRSLALLVLCASAAVLVPSSARAWDGAEHTMFGQTALKQACASVSDSTDACADAHYDYTTLSGKALAEPDHCHSFWFSATGISLNSSDSRKTCDIEFGTPNVSSAAGTLPAALQSISSGLAALDESAYVLMTNANHFGDNTEAHWTLYHQIALKAAKLRAKLTTAYATPPSNMTVTVPNPLLQTCTEDAVAIEAFSLHYLTDRAAGGHAWNAEPVYTGWTPLQTAGVRTCFHGQPTKTLLGTSATGFSCVDTAALGLGTPVYQGLGQTGRSFGGAFWDATKPGTWWSDGDYVAHNSGGSAQASAVLNPAEASFEELLTTLNGGSASDPTWTSTFVANQDFCTVALSECCRSGSSSGIGTCSSCSPDITDAYLKANCPVDKVQSGSVSGPGWLPLAHGGILGSARVYYAHLNLSGSAASGTNVAQDSAHHHGGPSNVNPDATWDQNHDIVTLLGCVEFDIANATIPTAPTDGTAVTATVKYDGNPTFPVIVHWRPNTDASKGPVCKAPSDNPHLCDARDYTVSNAPSGTTPTTPQPLTVRWACPGASGSKPAAGQGFLYLTDKNAEWTPPYPAAVNCGGADAGVDAGPDASADGRVSSGDGPAPGDGGSDVADGSGTAPDGTLGMGSCTHDVCTAGGPLNQNCGSCEQMVCAPGADPYCCTTLWGPSCFTAVQNLCGMTCP